MWAKRSLYGNFWHLTQELREQPKEFKRHYRMDPIAFDKLVEFVRPYIQKEDTNMRRSISVEERLAVTIK